MNQSEKPEDALEKEQKKGKKELGLERVRLALERLQLAWLRTAITFVALGFTAYKFYFARVEEGKSPLFAYFSGREIGMFLIFVGFLGLLQATFQHRRNWKKLGVYYPGLPYSVSLIQSYFVLAFTFTLLLIVTFKL